MICVKKRTLLKQCGQKEHLMNVDKILIYAPAYKQRQNIDVKKNCTRSILFMKQNFKDIISRNLRQMTI